MQSSAAVAGRALIMLACVVAIPAVALWGTSWPEVLKRLQDFHWPAVLDLASASMSTSPDEAPQVKAGGVTGTLATPCGPGRLAPAESPSPYCLTSNPASLQGQATAATQSAVVPAGYQVPAESAAATPPVVNAAGQSGTAATPAAGDQFHAIQDRLRQLGATYYLLESWGNEQQMYRFYCKMAVGGSTTTRVTSRPPIPTRSRPCSKSCGRWTRGATGDARRLNAADEACSPQARRASPAG